MADSSICVAGKLAAGLIDDSHFMLSNVAFTLHLEPVRIRPFSPKEAAQLAPVDNYQPFLGDGGLSASPTKPAGMGPSSANGGPSHITANAASSLRTKFLRSIITPVDDKVLIFDPPDNNPLTRLYNQNNFAHGNKRAKDQRYAFDKVFADTCGQEDVFEGTTKPLLDGILNGFNASVFAYGVSAAPDREALAGSGRAEGADLGTTGIPGYGLR